MIASHCSVMVTENKRQRAWSCLTANSLSLNHGLFVSCSTSGKVLDPSVSRFLLRLCQMFKLEESLRIVSAMLVFDTDSPSRSRSSRSPQAVLPQQLLPCLIRELRGSLGCSEKKNQPGTLEVNKQLIASFELTTSFPTLLWNLKTIQWGLYFSTLQRESMAQLTADLELHS